MDAQTLFREGVQAIRDQKDIERGRQLLMQSLALDSHNEMAWLWLTHTSSDIPQRLQYVEQALLINPNNEHALTLKRRLLARQSSQRAAGRDVIRPLGPKTADRLLTPQEAQRIQVLLDEAEACLLRGEPEAAIEQWVQILNIQVDHEIAIRYAVGHLWKLRYVDDAKELIWRAIKCRTPVPSIYLTAIDIAEREHDYARIEALWKQIIMLPGADEKLIITVADRYIEAYKFEQARQFLLRALERYPKSQKILLQLGDLAQRLDNAQEARDYYDRAARLGTRTREGKEADKRLVDFVPILTDRERGSVVLALRETLGFGLFFLLLGWQDAGLNLLQMGLGRWSGVALSLVGSYLLVTATSAPQQRPLASWLGGEIPPASPTTEKYHLPGEDAAEHTQLPVIPESTRYFLAMLGTALLVMAFLLVFRQSIGLLFHHSPPSIPDFHDL